MTDPNDKRQFNFFAVIDPATLTVVAITQLVVGTFHASGAFVYVNITSLYPFALDGATVTGQDPAYLGQLAAQNGVHGG